MKSHNRAGAQTRPSDATLAQIGNLAGVKLQSRSGAQTHPFENEVTLHSPTVESPLQVSLEDLAANWHNVNVLGTTKPARSSFIFICLGRGVVPPSADCARVAKAPFIFDASTEFWEPNPRPPHHALAG